MDGAEGIQDVSRQLPICDNDLPTPHDRSLRFRRRHVGGVFDRGELNL